MANPNQVAGHTEKMVDPYEAAREIRMAGHACHEDCLDPYPLDEMEDWVEQHGSTRLKKARLVGLLGSSQGVYRDERLAWERPGWRWNQDKLRAPVNPPERALDMLIAGRRDYGAQVELRFIKAQVGGEYVLADTFMGREIVKDGSPRG